jgi:hypothetical protein
MAPLEHEVAGVARTTDAIQQPLRAEAQQGQLEVLAALAGAVEQAAMDGRGEVDLGLPVPFAWTRQRIPLGRYSVEGSRGATVC